MKKEQNLYKHAGWMIIILIAMCIVLVVTKFSYKKGLDDGVTLYQDQEMFSGIHYKVKYITATTTILQEGIDCKDKGGQINFVLPTFGNVQDSLLIKCIAPSKIISAELVKIPQ